MKCDLDAKIESNLRWEIKFYLKDLH